MKIDLTIAQARRLVALIKSKSESNPGLMPVLDRLEWELEDHQKDQDAKGPWRKVVSHSGGYRSLDVLECGHTYVLRKSRNWVEDHAKRRRCWDCQKAAENKS